MTIGLTAIGRNDYRTNGYRTNDRRTNDYRTNDCQTNDYRTNDCRTNDHWTNDCRINYYRTNDCRTNDYQTNDVGKMTIGLMIVGLMTNAGFTYLWALGQTHQWALKFIEMLACFSIQYIHVYIYFTVIFLNGQMSTNTT